MLCCAQALAAWAVLKPEIHARLVVAGYSVGEVAAWGVAGALDPAAVFDVVVKRAALMDEASDGPSRPRRGPRTIVPGDREALP